MDATIQKKRSKAWVALLFVLLLVAIPFVVFQNVYEKTEASMKDLYQGEITLEQLKEKIAAKEEVYAYFYQPGCAHCKVVSPILIPMAKELGKPLFPVNIYQKDAVWSEYGIGGTPAMIHIREGQIISHIEGEKSKEELRAFLTE